MSNYKDEIWFKCLEEKLPDQARLLDDAYSNVERQAYNAFGSARTLLEKNIDYIGQIENKRQLRHGQGKLFNRIEILKKQKIVSNDVYESLHRIRAMGNKMHEGDNSLMAQKRAESILKEVEGYFLWFLYKYEDLKGYEMNINNSQEIKEDRDITPEYGDITPEYREIITKENIKIVKYCSNKKQCGRKYEDKYPYHMCIKCGALIDQIEEIEKIDDSQYKEEKKKQDTPKELNHYIIIGYNKKEGEEYHYVFKDKIKLEFDEVIIGRRSYTYNYIPDIDLTKYIDDDEDFTEVSRKHAMIYKKYDSFYIKNLTEEDDIEFFSENDENEVSIKVRESRVLKEDETCIIGNDLIFLNYVVE